MIHREAHFRGGNTVRDIVIGMSDGLTVPFALAAGVSGAVAQSRIVLTAGLAEVVAGAIAMGLGGYLASRGDAEHYASELARERREVEEYGENEAREVEELFAAYGVTAAEVAPIVGAFRRNHEAWVDFMMRFELGLERPEPGRAFRSAAAIGGSYVVGGFFPLVPYMIFENVRQALLVSAVVTLGALFTFGWLKARVTGAPSVRGAIQTTIVGALAAGAAFGLAHLFA
ncbi:VIT1/CCC1 transporter family protein [Labilithrix luteola]